MKKYIISIIIPMAILSLIVIFITSTYAHASAIKPSAIVIDEFVTHTDSSTITCKNTNLCSPDSSNSSRSATQTITVGQPYSTKNRGQIKAFSKSTFTKAFADRYGITESLTSGQMDLNTNIGNITYTLNGPKGYIRTIKTPKEGWWDVPGPSGTSDNIKGSDTSANWLDINARTNTGLWEVYTISGDSKKIMIIKGDSSRQYRVTVSLGVRTWHLNTAKDNGPDFNQRAIIDADNDDVPCESISVMGMKLNSKCEVTFVGVVGKAYDVTPSVNIPRYFYSQPSAISIVDAGPSTDQDYKDVSFPSPSP